jgi:AcrR family transcriptional regulator
MSPVLNTERTPRTPTPSLGPRPTSLRRDAARNRERVVRSALEVFAEFGALGTIDQVADRAGVGRATVYRSFPTRDALMTAVGVSQLTEVGELAQHCAVEAVAPGQAIIDFVYALFAYNRANRLYLELFRAELSDEVRCARDATRVAIGSLLAAAARAGTIRADVVDDDFTLLTGGLAVQLSLDPSATAEHWQRAPRLVLLALGVPDELATRTGL